ncbi:MAG: SCP2 sterol-binding domain-containing protein [Desulfatibacillaceae bacterium]
MPVFESTDKMYEVLGGLFRELMKDEKIYRTAMDTGISICFNITEPKGQLWLDPSDERRVICGSHDIRPTITMNLSGDSCHDFWLKKLSLPMAIAKGKIKAKGPMPKVLKMLPMLKPAHEMYPEIARSHGLPV